MQDAGEEEAEDEEPEEQEENSTQGADQSSWKLEEKSRFSLPRTKKRIQFQQGDSAIPNKTWVKYHKQIKERLQAFELQGSQTAGDRNISITRISPDGQTVAVGNWEAP